MPGTGSIFRRKSDKRWVAQVSSGPRDNRRIWRRYAPLRDNTRDAAKRRLAELLADLAVPRSEMAVGAYLERWVRDVRNIRPSTRHGYEVVVTHHLTPTIGAIPLGDLRPAHIETMLATLEPTMSAKSLRNVLVVLRRSLNQAVRAGLVARNVASPEFVDAPRVPLREPRALSAAEIRRFVDACRGDRLEALYLTALGTGLRQGELLGLEWQDVDLAKGELRVRQELVRRDGAYRVEAPKTDRSRRTVPLAAPLIRVLTEHRERLLAEGFTPVPTGPVFVNTTGGDLSGSWVTHHFYAVLERAGIARVPFKNLRTTFSSRLFEAGVADRVIADLLGHTRTRTTQQHYIATGKPTAPAVEAIGGLMQ